MMRALRTTEEIVVEAVLCEDGRHVLFMIYAEPSGELLGYEGRDLPALTTEKEFDYRAAGEAYAAELAERMMSGRRKR